VAIGVTPRTHRPLSGQAHTVGDARQDASRPVQSARGKQQIVVGATFEVHGEHLVFLNSEGKLA
jgi:hypothetical protein